MAKKIKKNKKIVNLAISSLVALLSLVAVLLGFAPSIVWGESVFSGWDVTFGYTSSSAGIGEILDSAITSLPSGIDEIFDAVIKGELFLFSFANLIPYVLALIALVGAVLAIFSKCRWISVAVALVSVVSGVLFLFVKDFTCLSETLVKIFERFGKPFAENEYVSLGGGVIASSSLMFVAGALSLVQAALSFSKK